MHTIPSTHARDLMAAWLATGGAIEPAPAGTAGDDGLSAATPTRHPVYCVEDSGLAAQLPTMNLACRVDDGLAAAQTNYYCRDADGLEAGHFTGPWACR